MSVIAIRMYARSIKRPTSIWQDDFEQLVFSKWAANSLVEYVESKPDIPPLLLTEEFAKQMDDYACMNLETSMIFSIGRDTIMDILDMLLQKRQ